MDRDFMLGLGMGGEQLEKTKDTMETADQIEPQVSGDFCEWKWDSSYDTNSNVSHCGYVMKGLYVDHNYKYCPHCGKEIKSVKEFGKNSN